MFIMRPKNVTHNEAHSLSTIEADNNIIIII